MTRADGLAPCNQCRGRGAVPAEKLLTQHGMRIRGGGWVPCPRCRGAKLEPAGDALEFKPDTRKGGERDAEQG